MHYTRQTQHLHTRNLHLYSLKYKVCMTEFFHKEIFAS